MSSFELSVLFFLQLAFILTVGRVVGWLAPVLLTITLICVMLGAWFTDRIGIYAVFGAFIMGAAMPR